MKRIIIVISIIATTQTLMPAQESNYAEVNALVEFGLVENYDSIYQLSSGLTVSERLSIYKRQKSDGLVGFVVNFIIGAGIGSFIQGDIPGGIIALLGDLGGVAGFYIGAGLESAPLLLGSLAILLGTRIFELIRPFSYAQAYNDDLRAALNLAAAEPPPGMVLLALYFPTDGRRRL